MNSANSFLASIQMMNLLSCEESLTPQMKALFKLVNRCRQLLDLPWNSQLTQCPKLKDNLRKIAFRGDKNNNTDDDEPPRKLPRTKEKQRIKSTFLELTPPKPIPAEDKLSCQEAACNVLFSSQAAMKAHFKVSHPEGQYVPPEKVVNPASGRKGFGMKRLDKVTSLLNTGD